MGQNFPGKRLGAYLTSVTGLSFNGLQAGPFHSSVNAMIHNKRPFKRHGFFASTSNVTTGNRAAHVSSVDTTDVRLRPGGIVRRAHAIGTIESARSYATFTGVVLLMLILGFVRLDRYPAPWFDEGIHLQVANNLRIDGTYAARSADGTLDYAPSIGVGPTLLLPVAGTMAVFGTSLTSGRAIPVIYLVVTTILLFAIARSLFGPRAGFATLAIALTMPALDWVETGRQVLGEVPAVMFLLLGGLLAVRAKRSSSLIAAGVVLGLSLVTKGQYVLIVPATLLALAAIDWRWTRHRTPAWHATLFVSVISTWIAWIATLLLVVGDGNVVENVGMLRDSSGGALLVFDASRMLAAWKVVLGPGTFFIALPSVLGGFIAIRSAHGDRRFALLSLWLFQSAWLGWFVFASIGWPRYAFAGLAVTTIFSGYLIDRLVAIAQRTFTRRTQPVPILATSAACLLLATLLFAGGWRTLTPIVREDGRDAERFAEVLAKQTPADAVIVSWEPELGILSDRAFQSPPPGSLNTVVRAKWFGNEMPDFSATVTGDFLVIGPFGHWVDVFRTARTSTEWQRIASVGQYELYQRLD